MLGAKQYIRYMDDFIILSPDKDELRHWLADIEAFLRDELRLALNPKTTILAAKNGVDFVGYKHRATHRKVRPDSIKRVKRTIKKCESGKITKEQLQKSIQSWTGHAGVSTWVTICYKCCKSSRTSLNSKAGLLWI